MTIRGGVASGFTAVAVTLVVAGAAYACTSFAGRFTVRVGSTTSVAVGAPGLGSGLMAYCGAPVGLPVAAASSGASVSVQVEPGVVCGDPSNPTNALPLGNYDVAFFNSTATSSGFDDVATASATGSSLWLRNDACGPAKYPGKVGANGTVKLSGTLHIDSLGRSETSPGTPGAKTFTLPSGLAADGPGEASAICVNLTAQTSALWGNQAPIVIV